MYGRYAKLRDAKGLTDYAVSKETGIATATLSCWKNGTYEPKTDKLYLIAKLFGVPIEYFLEEETKEQ